MALKGALPPLGPKGVVATKVEAAVSGSGIDMLLLPTKLLRSTFSTTEHLQLENAGALL